MNRKELFERLLKSKVKLQMDFVHNRNVMIEKSISDHLKNIQLFTTFRNDQLESLENYSQIRKYKPKEKVLVQGEKNKNLYILILGKLTVQVDGNTVASLEHMGEIIGEMSLVTGGMASATISCETPSDLLVIDLIKLNESLGEKKEEFNETLFKAFAISLAEKLRLTNQKAKYFEEFNDKHLSEIYQGQKITIKKLQEISNQKITKLRSHIETLTSENTEKRVKDILGELDYIQKSIEPIINTYNSSISKKNSRVLLAETNKRQQSIAKMALGGTGIELDIAQDIEEAREKLKNKSYDLIFVNSEMIPLIGEFEKNENIKFALMTSDSINQYIPNLKKLKHLPNIVSRDQEDRYFTSKNIVTTVSKLLSHDIFGLSKYLAWGVDIQQKEITGSLMRKDLNAEMKNYFLNLGVRSSRLDSVSLVAEELLMNAVYDAPTDANGKSLYNHLDRNVEVKLNKEHFGRFYYGTDGVLVGIAVEDPFGALSGQLVMDYLESCYGGQAGILNKEKGGAGRGLHMIVEMSDLVVFNIRPRQRTEVIALFYIENKIKDDKASNFHYFCDFQ